MTQFNREQWNVLSRLLDDALELPVEERPAWIAEQRLQHPELAEELEQLLERDAHIDRDDFLSTSRAPLLAFESTLAGQALGAYVLERMLGQGGMGSVWLARRNDGRFEGAAAIKFLSLAVAGPSGEARFRREGSVLARLTHPHIARLLDAGVSPTGLPYLVLEYVDGLPIDEWCDAHKLSVDGRLALFQQVLAAVADAHAHFIVHRDLKPANILVTGDGTVKLLDFGIAKLLDEAGASPGALTGAHDNVFTYKYAAPEQIKGESITTATDVYSLGVILYELLAGRHPTSQSASSAAEHALAIVNAESGSLAKAITPSGALTAQQAQKLAEARDASPERLRRSLAGDLDNIVTKALRKNPAERYGTVSALSDDIRHYLNHEPVSARADSFAYRARKFIRKHRVPVTIAALATIGLVAAAARERDLRGRAELEAKKAVAVETYLVSIFGAADPYAPTTDKPNDVTARTLLDRGAERMDTSLSDQPEVRAELRGALGQVYANLGVYPKATAELRTSLAERKAVYGANHIAVAEAMERLGEVLRTEDSLDEAEHLLRGALDMRRKLLGNKNEATAEALNQLGDLYVQRHAYGSAEPLVREALTIRRELYGDSALEVATSRNYLGAMLHSKGEDSAAAVEFRAALAIRLRRLGSNHPTTAQTLVDLGDAEERFGRYTDAEKDYKQGLEIDRKVFGEAHHSVASALNNLGQMLFKVGRLEEADSLLREALAINRKLFGENHEAVAANLGNLAIIVRERGDFDEAERLLEEALAIDQKLDGPEDYNVGFDLNEIAVVLRLRGRPDSAVKLLRRALAMTVKQTGENEVGAKITRVNLGRALLEARQYGESETMLRGALARLDTNNADEQMGIIPARIGLGRVLVATHRAREAQPVLESAVAMGRARSGPDHWRTAEAEVALAECLLDLGKVDRVEAPLKHGSEVLWKLRKAHPGLAADADTANVRFAAMRKAK